MSNRLTDPVLELSSVKKNYGTHIVLSNVSLQVQRGEVVAIIGPSGAGKSTLLRCVNGLAGFDQGSIRVLGISVDAMPDSSIDQRFRGQIGRLGGRIGMVFQSFNLFPHMSVLENLTLAPRSVKGLSQSDTRAVAMNLLKRIGLADRAKAYPRQLSGGQQQRVAICRALAMAPEIMLFDEVTSALDPELVGEVLDLIGELAANQMTMLIVTHEMAFAREVADRVLVMEAGAIIEDGPSKDVFAAPQQQRTRSFLGRVLRSGAIATDPAGAR